MNVEELEWVDVERVEGRIAWVRHGGDAEATQIQCAAEAHWPELPQRCLVWLRRTAGRIEIAKVWSTVCTSVPLASAPVATGKPEVPYAFVPVAVLDEGARVADTPEPPVLHHGANPEQAKLYSGELHCTLRPLTPLLVGNQQIEFHALDRKFQSLVLDRIQIACEERELLPADERTQLNKKKVIFPLRDASGAVLIAGESLKGMFRQALGALMSSPIERVSTVAAFSYRPNQFHQPPRNLLAARLPADHSTTPLSATVKAFDENRLHLVVELSGVPKPRRTVDPAIVRTYLESVKTYPDDPGRTANLRVDSTCFVEVLNDGTVVSLGDHCFYRWKQADTVTHWLAEFDGQRWAVGRRTELTAHDDERPMGPVGNATPAKLTAVRNMLGFVAEDNNQAMGQLARLEDPHNRLAGRISFNVAMERDAQAKDEVRFANATEGSLVFLHPLSSPKPQFFHSYVPGDGRSWGDGMRLEIDGEGEPVYGVQNGTQSFAGRKFYPHQLTAADKKLPAYHFDLVALRQMRDLHGVTWASREDISKYLWSDQATLACHVTKEGHEFGFTVRFKDLCAHELAALAAVLEPDRLARCALNSTTLPQTVALLKAIKLRNSLAFGHKLGHGRPLGMGSVTIRIDATLRWPQTLVQSAEESTIESQQLDELITCDLLPRLNDQVARSWFEVLQLYPEVPFKPYMLARQETLAWSQEMRKQHSRVSRKDGFG